ncbi:MAG: GIY-YIG nuclease family protein [Pseudomonadota bacterium]
MMFFVYMLECSDGAYYVGSHRGDFIEDRISAHNMGLNPKSYTYIRRPVRLIWSEAFENPEDMISAERRLKGWSRAKKEAFISGDMPTLKALSRSRTAPADPAKSRIKASLDEDLEKRRP